MLVAFVIRKGQNRFGLYIIIWHCRRAFFFQQEVFQFWPGPTEFYLFSSIRWLRHLAMNISVFSKKRTSFSINRISFSILACQETQIADLVWMHYIELWHSSPLRNLVLIAADPCSIRAAESNYQALNILARSLWISSIRSAKELIIVIIMLR